jgi:oligopeptide/dipeptide ABC transporter ATP-binding protein
MQLVPQDPQTSFNPRLSIRSSIEFNLRAQRVDRSERARRVEEAMDRVGMPAAYGQRYPHELSGGQLQRAAIARALVTRPELIVCDEAVSALDKSIQAQVLNLLVELQQDLGMAYLFISHDLSVVEHLSDRVLVMYLGRVVEEATATQLWARPRHPYTEALLSAAPSSGRTRIMLAGDPPSPVNPPSGCSFRTRCPVALPACADDRPPLEVTERHHLVACINPVQTN